MKKTALVMTMIAGVSFGGIPIQWDVRVGYDQRFNESSPVAYNITAMRGETLDLMPRYMSSGYPFSIASNADVRIYLREYGTTNAFTVSSTSGTVYTTSSQLGRVRAVLLPSDIPATGTNQFFVGIESSGMVYRAYGKLTLLDSPGVIVSTNQIARGVFDSSVFTFSNSHLAPWLLLSDIGNYCGVQSVNGLTGVVSITAESLGALTNVPPQSYAIITNAPWAYETNTASITITNGLASTSYVAAAVAAIPEADAFVVRDSADTNRWWRFEGTNAVQYEVTAITTLLVTLSSEFEETVTQTRPLWSVHVWPFDELDWDGFEADNVFYIISSVNGSVPWTGINSNGYPVVLYPASENASGIATVDWGTYYQTNLTGNVLCPTNVVTDAGLAAWWVETEATKLDAQEFDDHVTPAITPDPHIQYLLETNAVTAEMVTNIAHAVNEVTTIRYAVSNASDIAGYLILTNAPSTNETKYIVAANPTNGQYVAQFVAEPFGVAGSISEGHIEARVHMSISGGGSLSVVAEPYLVDGSGNTVVEWAGGNVVPVPGVDGDGDLFVTPVNTAYTYAPTDRRALKIKVVAKTGVPVLTIAMEDGKQLTLAFPVPTSFFASKLDLTDYLPKTYTNAVPVAGNTLLVTDGTNLTVTGATFAYRAFPTNAYQLSISPTAPAFHYGGTIIGTNAVTFATNLLLRGTATVSGTNCFALQPWSNGVWEVLWGAK